MPTNAGEAAGRGPGEACLALERFLKASHEPILLEDGETPLLLRAGNYEIQQRGGHLLFEAWDERRNLTRRVTGVEDERAGRLLLRIERFGKRPGTLALVDGARRAGYGAGRRAGRSAFREQFRRFLRRQFVDWRIAEISSEPDLEHSLSPAYARAFLRKGAAGWAALGVPPGDSEPAHGLSFGLIWLDYLRRRERRVTVEGLAMFLPGGRHQSTCLRLRCLNPAAAAWAVFVYSDGGQEERLDPRDWGNLDTRLEPCARPRITPEQAAWIERLRAIPGVETVEAGAALSVRVRGFEFGRFSDGSFRFGLETRTRPAPSSSCEVVRLAEELSRLRSAGARDRTNPLWRRHPERWLESQVRTNIEALDAALLKEPLYGQVPAVAGVERGVIDLLAAERGGRLAVLELKADEDIHLPLQALDYWLRVKWHAERNEFSAKGYFPGLPLLAQAPRLILAAPAMGFHPTTETVLGYFDPGIEVERAGLSVEWRERVRVVMRAKGAQSPMWL